MTDRAKEQLARRTARDRSIALLLIGTILLLPPFASVFLIDGNVVGVPVPFAYILAVWALLIAGAAFLSLTLRDGEHPPSTSGPPDVDN